MIINYLITNINAKRQQIISPDVQVGISNNISITDVEKDDKFKILKFTFKFDASFSGGESNELGKIVVEGVIVYTGEDIESIYSQWADSKRLDNSITEEVLQASLNISMLEAMSIAKQLQLPSLLPLPKVSANPQKNGEAGAEDHKHDKKSGKSK